MTTQDDQTKLALIQALNNFSGNLISFLNKLNLNPTLKSYCFMNLDQASFWAREAIAHMQLNFPAEEKTDQETMPVTEITQEVVQENKTIQ